MRLKINYQTKPFQDFYCKSSQTFTSMGSKYKKYVMQVPLQLMLKMLLEKLSYSSAIVGSRIRGFQEILHINWTVFMAIQFIAIVNGFPDIIILSFIEKRRDIFYINSA